MIDPHQETAHSLKKIIKGLIADNDIDPSWAAPKTNDRELLVEHLDELCNEHGVTV